MSSLNQKQNERTMPSIGCSKAASLNADVRQKNMTKSPNTAAIFKAIDSFYLTPDKTYGIIGDISEGKIEAGYFVNIPLNSSMSVCARIDKIQDIQFSRFDDSHKVIFVKNRDDDFDFTQVLHCMNVDSEILEITFTGEE
jgi:hypothetical protein